MSRPAGRQAPPLPHHLGLLLALALGLVHAGVDAASGVVLSRSLPEMRLEEILYLYLLYNFCAFALQAPLGLLLDRLGWARPGLLVGLALVALSLLLPTPLWVPILVTGIGNALFHLGGGIIATAALPNRVAGVGIFIGPGAIGVVLGRILGPVDAARWVLLAVLLLGMFLAARVPIRAVAYPPLPPPAAPPAPRRLWLLAIPAVLFFGAVAIRSLGGLATGRFVTGGHEAFLLLASGACLGKMAGGLLADRFGWIRTSLLTLVLSALLLAVNPGWFPGLLASAFLFQIVTSVTLGGFYYIWPRHLGWSFGISCLALFCGALPILLKLKLPALESAWVLASLTLLSAAAVTVGLALLFRDPEARARYRLLRGEGG